MVLMWIRSIGYNGHLSLVASLLIQFIYFVLHEQNCFFLFFHLIEMVSRDNLCTITVAVQLNRSEPHPQNYAFYQRLHLIEHDFFFLESHSAFYKNEWHLTHNIDQQRIIHTFVVLNTNLLQYTAWSVGLLDAFNIYTNNVHCFHRLEIICLLSKHTRKRRRKKNVHTQNSMCRRHLKHFFLFRF